MKKNIIFIIIAVLLMCLIYFGYKGFYLFYYNLNILKNVYYSDLIDGLEVKDSLTIRKTDIENNNYLTFKNMKIRNDFTNFNLLENQSFEDSVKYVLHDEKGDIKASFWMSIGDNYIDLLREDKTLFGTNDNRTTNEELISLLEKNNIKTDLQLFEYLRRNKDTKNNIFMSIKEMKQNYNIRVLVSIMLPSIDSITLINGDYTGYIFNLNNNFKEVSIVKNDKRYIFMFMKTDYFTDEYITELLNTIEITI